MLLSGRKDNKRKMDEKMALNQTSKPEKRKEKAEAKIVVRSLRKKGHVRSLSIGQSFMDEENKERINTCSELELMKTDRVRKDQFLVKKMKDVKIEAKLRPRVLKIKGE